MSALIDGIRMYDNLGTFYGTHGRLCLEPGGRTI